MAYDNPAGLIAAAVIVEAIVTGLVVVRIYGRRKYSHRPIASDWIILVAFICSLGLTILHIYGVAIKSLGTPLGDSLLNADGRNERLQKSQYITTAYLLIGNLTLGLIKLSASFFYLRIFNPRPFQTIIIVWIVILACWTFTSVVGALLQCGTHLLALFQTHVEVKKYCYPQTEGIGYAWQALNVGTDIVTLCLPIPMVWTLHMPFKKKMAITCVFLIGLLSVGAGIAKAYYYIAATLRKYKADPIIISTSVSVWNLAESQVGIIATCLITMRRILKDLLPMEGFSRLLASSTSLGSQRNVDATIEHDLEASNTPPSVPKSGSGPGTESIELSRLESKSGGASDI